MKVRDFLQQVTDDGSVLRVLALDVIEGMSDVDFEELCMEMRYFSADTWVERRQAAHNLAEMHNDMSTEHLLGRGGMFHPTNRDND